MIKSERHSKSPFAESYPDYPDKIHTLAKQIGTTQFLWAVEQARDFKHHEIAKPVEWVVGLSAKRILGYVDVEKWFAFLEGRDVTLSMCFSKTLPKRGDTNVILPFPLFRKEVLIKRVRDVRTPDDASILSEQVCTTMTLQPFEASDCDRLIGWAPDARSLLRWHYLPWPFLPLRTRRPQ